MKVSVILPTFNEKENIASMLSQVMDSVTDLEEVIVVDDNSPDRTWEIVQGLQNEKIKLIRRINEKGLASAIAKGISFAKGDVVVWMDCDLSMPPSKIKDLVRSLESADIAVGSRYVNGGKDQRSFSRVLTSRLMNLFANLFLGFVVRDYDSGFVAVKKEVFNSILLPSNGHGEYCIEFLYKCSRKGYKIKEVPYVFTDRKKGCSKTAGSLVQLFGRGFQYCFRVIRVKLNGENTKTNI